MNAITGFDRERYNGALHRTVGLRADHTGMLKRTLVPLGYVTIAANDLTALRDATNVALYNDAEVAAAARVQAGFSADMERDQREMTHLRNTIEAQKRTIDERDKLIDDLKREVAGLQGTVSAQVRTIDERGMRLQEMHGKIEQREATIKTLSKEAASAQQYFVKVADECKQLRHDYNEQRNTIECLTSQIVSERRARSTVEGATTSEMPESYVEKERRMVYDLQAMTVERDELSKQVAMDLRNLATRDREIESLTAAVAHLGVLLAAEAAERRQNDACATSEPWGGGI